MRVSSVRARRHQATWQESSSDGIVTRWPLTTALLLLTMVLVFAIETHLASPGEDKTIGPLTQIMLGGLSETLAQTGQWFRLLSYALLHASVEHLVSNAIALAVAGFVLERIVGHVWMFCIFTLGAVFGGIASLLYLPPSTVTVGASGAIMAVLAALFMTSFRLPSGRMRLRVQVRTFCIGFSGIVPRHSLGPIQVNYADHIGGAIIGLAIGGLLLKDWDDRSSRPPCAVEATLLSVVAILAFSFSAYAASISYRSYGPAGRYIYPALIPKRPVDIAAHGNELAASFPFDARSHIFAGMADIMHGQAHAAEREFDQALKLNAAAPGFYQPNLMNRVHLDLALLLFSDGRRSEALTTARPFCQQPVRDYPTPALAVLVSKDRLCG